jgi:hypothetical protein
VVSHFAAYAYVGGSKVDPLKYCDNNLNGSANLLKRLAQLSNAGMSWVSRHVSSPLPLTLTDEDARYAAISGKEYHCLLF